MQEMIIDFHTHVFPTHIAGKALEQLSENGHARSFTDGTTQALIASMHENGIYRSVTLPVMTKVSQVHHVNESIISGMEDLLNNGIIPFGGLHPDMQDPFSEIRFLKDHGIAGVKLHPAFQRKHVNDLAYKRIIDALSKAGMITVIHSGMDIGIPEDNYASVSDILELIRDVQPERLVLAHMGGWQAWDEVLRDLAGAPVWLDTSFSLGPLFPKQGHESLLSYASNLSPAVFAALARAHGIRHILFATDSPWADQRQYLSLIREAGFDRDELSDILSRNALRLLENRSFGGRE